MEDLLKRRVRKDMVGYNKKSNMDLSNITCSSKVSDLYDISGRVLPFHQQKYKPLIDYIINYFEGIKRLKEITLLDVGIGYGAFLKLCEEKELKRLYGMDPFPNSIAIAKRYTSADLRVGKIEDLPWPFEENYFDVITCLDVIEHLQYPTIFFKNSKKYINDNGIIIVRTPNGELPYFIRKLPLIGVKDDNPTHINIRSPKYWKKLAKINGFDIIKEWKGEHLTHINYINYIGKISDIMKIDHRKIPILNTFEQAYIMILKK